MRYLISLVFISLTMIASGQTIMKKFKEAVLFIYVDRDTSKAAAGTGFAVSMPSDVVPNLGFMYIVTAKHVIQTDNDATLNNIYLRYNSGDTSSMVPIRLFEAGPLKNVFYHPDSTVDLAVIPVPDFIKPKPISLAIDQVSSKEQFRKDSISEGMEVFFTGLFTTYTGDRKIYPIVRSGNIALVTSERLEMHGKKRELILIESMAFPGNSGSPVYIRRHINDFTVVTGLGGILNAIYTEPIKIKDFVLGQTNVGISLMTPVFLLHEIIFGRELKNSRKEALSLMME